MGTEGAVPNSASFLGTSTGTASRVFANDKGIVCFMDPFLPHAIAGLAAHTPLAGGSGGSRVTVGGKDVFTYGQLLVACVDTMILPVGSNVNVGV